MILVEFNKDVTWSRTLFTSGTSITIKRGSVFEAEQLDRYSMYEYEITYKGRRLQVGSEYVKILKETAYSKFLYE